ncbi:2-phospho-L-lactate guanylyltransferase [Microbacterium sp. zg.Y1090]|uniref:2-phospho-L-lactate guanylyltransferase n=1 Tax=Microbacterium wangruii TaxID=3049073 RepID=UPI00214D8E8A|nr:MULTISPECIES: 2-phospho-L-lactate guanylyltransferase [unclassified Microbacterium]MCR2819573.1 2-phospho-L-lactate guanylyltransferase [Microbacterium sp. zg.Y1090]WIM28540.1 2-phospho-L-lactate guanylyltransferase [Microbacterium sp. zg-Y1090]
MVGGLEATDAGRVGPDEAVAAARDGEPAEAGWIVVVPVKPAETGKSRLAVPGIDRQALARAIARDTIAAAARTPGVERVVVVSSDPDVAATVAGAAGAAPVEVVGDPGEGLDAAVAMGAAGFSGRARAALLGDLPALQPVELANALRSAGRHRRAVVGDAIGTGSTLVTAAGGLAWRSAFGAGSFGRHRKLGAVAVTAPAASGLRNDVDTAQQLRTAEEIGVGPRTTALLHSARNDRGAVLTTARLRLRDMQESDLDAMAGLLGDSSVMRYYAAPYTREQAADWIARNRSRYRADGFGLWIIEDHDGGFVGDCGLTWQRLGTHRVLEVGYHVAPRFQRRGYATEATAAVRDLARTLGFDEVRALIHPRNAASTRVATKIGMHRDAEGSDLAGITVMRMEL